MDAKRDVKRVTANLPADLLQDAMAVTGEGITETLVKGLTLVRRSGAFKQAMRLQGKIQLDVDLEESRERRPRSLRAQHDLTE
jgi:hypothetical protein